ncbi:MAG: hypothetical protein ABR532_05830 [Candidatus Dormibacteria bacterium]
MSLSRRTPLKRGSSLQRRTPLTAAAPLRRHVGLTASRKPLPSMSDRRKAELPERQECRRIVLERDPICVFPGCTRPSTEVHELHRGAGRHTDYLDPKLCRGVCWLHHGWTTRNPAKARRLGLALRTGETLADLPVGTPELARALGAPA